MMRTLLLRGMLAGLAGGVFAAIFAFVVGEPEIGHAISLEEDAHAHGHESAPVSRGVQRTLGLLLGTGLYGLAFGGLFALAFAALYGRVGRAGPARTAGWLALCAFVAVFLMPFLKYPANPPAVGDPDTIGERTGLYLLMVACSLLAALAALRIGRLLGDGARAVGGGIAAYLVVVVVAAVALPGVNEVPADFPAETLYRFRMASLGTQLVLWSALGTLFALAAQRTMVGRPAVAS